MDFLKKIGRLFNSSDRESSPVAWVYVRCNRCGEVIASRINLHNDLSVDYVDGKPIYYCRKVLVGQEKLCFQRVEIHLKFNEGRNLIDREISGGVFISEEEYSEEPVSSEP